MSGLKLAALYGFYPHQLGFCGEQKSSAKKTLLKYLSGEKIPEQKIRKILETFKAAFPYYKLIAKSNGIQDPFDERVVRAYWIGNHFLEKVTIGSLPHHSFHVLVIGSVTGRIKLKGKLLDFCRIGWGKVIEIRKQETKSKTKVVIEYHPIQKKGKKYFLAKPIHKLVFWNRNFIPEIKIGDRVAIHWNHVIQILNKRDFTNLKKYTKITIDSINN